MNYEEKRQWAMESSIDDIVQKRDQYEIESSEWLEWNTVKSERLEQLKPSTKEEIIFFKEIDLDEVPEGLSKTNKLPSIPFYRGKRSLLEYNPTQRHPIPYVIVKHKKYYFFIIRGKGVGEIRLENKKGMLGGHVGVEDIDELSLSKTLLNGLRRELEEEAGITDELIQSIEIQGLLKSNDGVDRDHLGVIYQIELLSKDISSQEEELSGIWIHEKDLEQHVDSFESWARIIYENVLKA